jgi:hypothetical protein
VRERPRGGRRERVTGAAWQRLTKEVEAGQIGEFRGVPRSLRTRCGIRYRSLSGVSRFLQRHGGSSRRDGADSARPVRNNTPLLKKHFGATLAPHGVKRVFARDEARLGLKSWHRRWWRPRGIRPPGVVEDRCEWLWLSAAREPRTGRSVFLLLPSLESHCFALFVRGLRRHYRRSRVGVVLTNSPSHVSQQVRWPRYVVPLRLPP